MPAVAHGVWEATSALKIAVVRLESRDPVGHRQQQPPATYTAARFLLCALSFSTGHTCVGSDTTSNNSGDDDGDDDDDGSFSPKSRN